jgi:DNA-binding transcriptional LysR family regulator
MLNITLRQIEYATATARCGGVTAAAESLNVSQPALSVALAQLEAVLGQPLFLRRPGGRITPTSFGRTWLAEAQAQLDALTRLMSGETPVRPGAAGLFRRPRPHPPRAAPAPHRRHRARNQLAGDPALRSHR